MTTEYTKLRRLLDEATPGPWMAEGSQVWGPDGVLVAVVREHSALVDRPDALIIAAAVNALPDLLDALDVAEAAVERVRELHTPVQKWCKVHESARCECECADAYCEACGASWPCPTLQALNPYRQEAVLPEISSPLSPKHSKADLKGLPMIPARDIDYASVAHLARCVRLTARNGWRDSFTVDAIPETDALTDPELIALCGLGDVPFGGSVKRGNPHRVDVYTD